jgi:hypothetical protein
LNVYNDVVTDAILSGNQLTEWVNFDVTLFPFPMSAFLRLSPNTQLELVFCPVGDRYLAKVTVVGERIWDDRGDVDLFVFPDAGGVIVLRVHEPLLGNGTERGPWSSSYWVESSQLRLIATHPTIRIGLGPWTGPCGIPLYSTTEREELMQAARCTMGLDGLAAHLLSG